MANTSKQGGTTGQTGTQQRTQDTVSSAAERAKDMAQSAADTARSAASSTLERTRDMASNLGDRAQDMASNLGQRAEDVKSGAGDQMKSLAGTIRQNAPQEGMTGRAASAMADALESGGSYLQEHGFGDMAGDMANLIRQYPIPAVLIGIGVGFLLARATRS